MLKIGEFSRLSQVTVATLHHYDDIGLLKPAQVDKFTNHRFYTLEQLPRIHRIMTLKELGLSLEQITKMLNAELPTDHLRGMLALKEAEAQQQIDEEQARLKRIRFHIRQIDMEVEMSNLDVVIKKVDPVYGLTLRTTLKRDEMVALGQEFEQALADHHIKVTRPAIEIHYAEEFVIDFIDVEYVLPVDETVTEDIPLPSFGTLKVKTVPGIELAGIHIQHGVSEDQGKGLLAMLQRWVVGNGYKLDGAFRMVFHRGPLEHADYDDWIIEFQHPLVKA